MTVADAHQVTASDDFVLLDGGMGGELISRGIITGGGLWSAQALLECPENVLAIHRDYIKAGARVISTNTYSTVPSYLEKENKEEHMEDLIVLAGKLARQASSESQHPVIVAGSLPPLDESYRPDLVPDHEESLPIYETLARLLEPYVDVFLCETMSSIQEAKTAFEALSTVNAEVRKPVYVSFTLDERPGVGLRSGEPVSQAVAQFAEANYQANAIMFNCSAPETITVALEEAKKTAEVPLGCYPNRFLEVPEEWTLDDEKQIVRNDALNEISFLEYASRWRQIGAKFIGGCCGIGPSYIQAVYSEFVQGLDKLKLA